MTVFTSNTNNFNIDAHYSSNMKVTPPKVTAEAAAVNRQKTLYSDREATEKLQKFNTEIYQDYKKEKSKNEFNFKTYFKIFGGFILAAASIAGIRRIIKWFKGK